MNRLVRRVIQGLTVMVTLCFLETMLCVALASNMGNVNDQNPSEGAPVSNQESLNTTTSLQERESASIQACFTIDTSRPEWLGLYPPMNLEASGGLDGHVPLSWEAPAELGKYEPLSDMRPQAKVSSAFNSNMDDHSDVIPLSKQAVAEITGFLGYIIYRGQTQGGPYPTLVAMSVQETAYDDSTVTNGIQYFYVVSASYDAGVSTYTNEASARPIEGCVGGQRGDIDGNGIINILDVLDVVNHILDIVPITDPDALCRADCNGDGSINVLDALAIVNVILNIIPHCGGVACKAEVTSEVIAYLQSLKGYLSLDDFSRFMTLVKSHIHIPMEYKLAQNYPNPFNPNTTIRYAVPRREQRAESGGEGEDSGLYALRTTLTIYNILGQEVRTLVDEAKEPGSYEVTWDGKDGDGRHVASGVYFYRLSVDSGQWSATRRMVLMK